MSEITIKKFNFFSMFWTGFKNMSNLGKTLWAIVIIKLIIMFIVLRPIFFQNYLNNTFEDEASKAEFVAGELIDPIK